MVKVLLSTIAVALALSIPSWAQTAADDGTTGQTQAGEATNEAAASEEAIKAQEAETEFQAEELMGMPVRSPEGEAIGEVEDLILDEDDEIMGVVVGVGGFLGVGEKQVGLNWEQAEVQEDPESGRKTIVVGLTKDELEAAPAFLTQEERAAEEAAARQQTLQDQQPALPTPTPTPAIEPAGEAAQ